MDPYLQKNKDYYDQGYEAENVESYVFRPYGRIFKHDFGIDGSKGEKLLDFGCGSGATLRFFKSKGFDVYGVDISEVDIQRAQSRMPDIGNHFQVIPPKPAESDRFFDGGFDIVVSIQTLYFLSNSDLQVRLKTLYDMMKPGALIYASMMGTQSYFSKYATPAHDGLSKVDFANDRISYKDFYVNLTDGERDLEHKFSMFEKVYIGYYDRDYRNEGSEFHYTFTGRKV